MNKQIDFTQYQNKGYTGLANLGNTCFLNSIIQILNHTYELVELLNGQKIIRHAKCDLPDYVITREWIELRNMMWSTTSVGIVSPNKFVHNVQHVARIKDRELFTGWAQNDMSEFLLFIMESMHNSISRSIKMKIKGNPKNQLDELAIKCYTMLKTIYTKEYSEIMELLYGVYISEIKSIDNKITYIQKPEHFFLLDLPIPQKPDITLYDCFDLFTQPENMQDDNAWYNQKTNSKEPVMKRIMFWSLPNILIITLKRYSPDGLQKINDLVHFPMDDLRLSKYVEGYNPNKYVYELYGVCNHTGSILGGHYTSFVKNASNEWVHYNDTTVSIIQNQYDVISPMSYCLFYRKKIT